MAAKRGNRPTEKAAVVPMWPAAVLLSLVLLGIALSDFGVSPDVAVDRAAFFAGLAGLGAAVLLLGLRSGVITRSETRGVLGGVHGLGLGEARSHRDALARRSWGSRATC